MTSSNSNSDSSPLQTLERRAKGAKNIKVSEDQIGKRLHHQPEGLMACRKPEGFTCIYIVEDQGPRLH